MNRFLMPATLSAALIGSTYGASSFNFDSEGIGDIVYGGGVSGWTQNIANPLFEGVPLPFAYTEDQQFTAAGGISRALYLGTRWLSLEPGAPQVVISGDMSDAGLIAGTTLTLNLGIVTEGSHPLDGFGLNLKGSSGTVVSLAFTPTASDTWGISYGTGGSFTTTASTIEAMAGYQLFFEFLEDSIRVLYGTAESGVGTHVIAEIESGPGSQTYDALEFVLDPSEEGHSFDGLFVDNIAVVPEPTAPILIGAAGLIGLIRRRR